MISLQLKSDFTTTTLEKVDDNLWEFDPTSKELRKNPTFESRNQELLKENSLLDRKGLKTLLKGLKKFIKKKNKKWVIIPIKWIRNSANIQFKCYYRNEDKKFKIGIGADNKARKNFAYGQEDIRLMEQGDPDPKTQMSILIHSVSEENLEKYIEELEEEIKLK